MDTRNHQAFINVYHFAEFFFGTRFWVFFLSSDVRGTRWRWGDLFIDLEMKIVQWNSSIAVIIGHLFFTLTAGWFLNFLRVEFNFNIRHMHFLLLVGDVPSFLHQHSFQRISSDNWFLNQIGKVGLDNHICVDTVVWKVAYRFVVGEDVVHGLAYAWVFVLVFKWTD